MVEYKEADMLVGWGRIGEMKYYASWYCVCNGWLRKSWKNWDTMQADCNWS